MFVNQETRKRNAFVEASIENSHNKFADDPHMQARLGKLAPYLAKLTGRMFIPNIRGDELRIPRKYREDGVAVIARHSGDPPLTLSADFACFTQRQRIEAAYKLSTWSYDNLEHRIDNIEKVARFKTADEKPQTDLVIRRSDGRQRATTLSVEQNIIMRDRHIRLRPLTMWPYDGTDTPLVAPAVMAHHAMHVRQSEGAVLGTLMTAQQRLDRSVRWELEAFTTGALAVYGTLDSGISPGDLHPDERQQLIVDAARRAVATKEENSFTSQHEMLQHAVQAAGIDFSNGKPGW
jgi:hypothetical protein